jgi:hypothetical protein
MPLATTVHHHCATTTTTTHLVARFIYEHCLRHQRERRLAAGNAGGAAPSAALWKGVAAPPCALLLKVGTGKTTRSRCFVTLPGLIIWLRSQSRCC